MRLIMSSVIIIIITLLIAKNANATYNTTLSWGRGRIMCSLSQKKVFDEHGYYICVPVRRYTPRWRWW